MNGIIIGVLYIVAAVSAVIAVIFYQPVLSDQWYLAVENGFETKILLGVLNDLLLVVSAVGTAVMLFPYIRKWNEHLALGYLCLRFMEAVFIAIGLVSILGLVSLSIQFDSGSLTKENAQGAGFLLQAFHRWTFMLGPNLMLGINTFLYSYLLFKTGIIPKSLAIFGMVTAILVLGAGLLDMFGIIDPVSTAKGILALPVGVYEMSLAAWLIVKGFNKNKLNELRGRN
jgi:hypothetical protein